MKRIRSLILCMGLLCSSILLSPNAHAAEGNAQSFWGNIPENTTFAFVESRYYDGTDAVEIFNVGFYMGNPGQYYTNGDWTDLSHVYRREDYYKNEEFIEYTETATPGQLPRPEGYPTNDVGGDADGKLPSYNAGTYTYLSWSNFSMFGRKASTNYAIDNVIHVPKATTYVEIWKVAPQLSLRVDQDEVNRGDEFTLTLTIANHFNNMDGLPKAEEVAFTADHATAVSAITKKDNTYSQTFVATADQKVDAIHVTASVLDIATNYKEASEECTLAFPKTFGVSYEFIDKEGKRPLPEEVLALLPTDPTAYLQGEIANAILPSETKVAVEDGTWIFQGYDADHKEVSNADIMFTGSWTFTANASAAMGHDTSGHNGTNAPVPQTGDRSNLSLFSLLFLLSGGCLISILIRFRRGRKSNE